MPKSIRRLLVALAAGVAAPLPLPAQAGSPAGAVPVASLQARQRALIARLKSGVAVIRGAEELSDDPPDSKYPQAASFRQDNDFFYLTGLETPDSWVIVVAADSTRGETYLFLPARNPQAERWTGPQLGPGAEAAAATGIPAANIHSADSVEVYLRRFVRASPTLYFRRTSWDSEPGFIRELALDTPRLATQDLLPALAALRAVKDEDEIRRLTRAVALTAEGHIAAMQFARPGVFEYQIEAVAEQTFRTLGAERLGYPSIVGSGINSTVLHYDQNRRQTQAGDLIVMDMGAEFGYQTADVTRTIPVSGKFTPRQKAVYELVLGAQQIAIDSVRPGVTLRQLDGIARRYITDHSGDLCGAGGCGRYFIHGLSHWIGMDVHDVGGGLPLAPGMAFTVEPGIYLPDEALGVRIEDDVLVTAGGYEVLSKAAPRTVAEIEKVMARRK
ncbi:MAG TPA: aminopeptidase P family protein [Gemmatimonadales bacterium]